MPKTGGTRRKTGKAGAPAPNPAELLRLQAEAAAAMFARCGSVLPMWNTRRVLGSVIARGLADRDALRRAGLNVPPPRTMADEGS